MAELKSRAKWRGEMGFTIHAGDHEFIVDAPLTSGGKNEGPKPSYLLQAALMSCTGMDVASILAKMRVPLGALHLETSADVADEDPHVFRSIDIVYHFEGDGLENHEEQVKRAIKLSKETYCCVSIMFRKVCPIRLRAFINGKELAFN
jgi:putative redox protein